MGLRLLDSFRSMVVLELIEVFKVRLGLRINHELLMMDTVIRKFRQIQTKWQPINQYL